MYRTLLKMKKLYKYEDWLKMVNQAYERKRLTDEEYSELTQKN